MKRERKKEEEENEQTAKLKSLDENGSNVFFIVDAFFSVEIHVQ